METFILIAGRSGAANVLRQTAAVLLEVMPDGGASLGYRIEELANGKAAMLFVGPTDKAFEGLVDFYRGDHFEVVLYGRLNESAHPACWVSRWLERFPGKLEEASEQFDGSFGLAIVDRMTGAVHCSTDAIGNRGLFFIQSGAALLISPHLVSLIATGACAGELDPASLASLAGIDWAVGGYSLLTGMRPLGPTEVLTFRECVLDVRKRSPFDFKSRIHSLDFHAQRKQREIILQEMVSSTRRYAAQDEHRTLKLKLTAGLDSRAVLGLFIAADLRSRITTITRGDPDHNDVVVAAKIAAACNVLHERKESGQVQSFDKEVRLNAFLCNGESSSKNSLIGPFPLRKNTVGGTGGEIYRGFYYPLLAPLGFPLGSPYVMSARMLRLLRRTRLSSIGVWDKPMHQTIERRLESTLQVAIELGATAFDCIDLLYLWERYRRWGATAYRQPRAQDFTPFISQPALRALFRLPPGVGKRAGIHALAIRRALPRSVYLTLVNGSGSLLLDRNGETGFVLRQGQLATSIVYKRVAKALGWTSQTASIDAGASDVFRTSLFESIHGLLTSERSWSRSVLGADVLEKLLQTHRTHGGQLEPIAFLATIETFRELVDRTRIVALQRPPLPETAQTAPCWSSARASS